MKSIPTISEMRYFTHQSYRSALITTTFLSTSSSG